MTAQDTAEPSNESVIAGSMGDDIRHSDGHIAHAGIKVTPSAPLINAEQYSDGGVGNLVRDEKMTGAKSQEQGSEKDASRLAHVQPSRPGRTTMHGELRDKRPLNLLDLPMDILKDIFNEVRHTNDLTALALTHSALHNLAIPHIYSRFDIVWPDTTNHTEPRSGVDALTYGLATLVMAEEIFERRDARAVNLPDRNRFTTLGHGRASERTIRKRRGNHYAQFTKKFSLGNGPSDWVQEYFISKEGGKMLGTLVALAVARMRSLETFIWDMPTGILRDVWLSLSSLGDYDDYRLEKVWVRWHVNTLYDSPRTNLGHVPVRSPSDDMLYPAYIAAPRGTPLVNTAALDRVEHPNFSVLPPLKSLSVVDIDELSYLDEMSILVGRSLDKLNELRVGIAQHARSRDWTMVWDDPIHQQVDLERPEYGSLTIGEKRFGGILGILAGHFCDLHEPEPIKLSAVPALSQAKRLSKGRASIVQTREDFATVQGTEEDRVPSAGVPIEISGEEQAEVITGQPIAQVDSPVEDDETYVDSVEQEVSNISLDDALSPPTSPTKRILEQCSSPIHFDHAKRKRLRLDNLELERVPMSIVALRKMVDWSLLTSLTLLQCANNEQLWKILRRSHAPTPKTPLYPQQRHPSSPFVRKGSRVSSHAGEVEFVYHLSLKKIHTDTVSPALISFLKETLAPNSLEVLFLQDAQTQTQTVTIDAIYRGPLRRHRSSLRKLLIDSSDTTRRHLSSADRSRRPWMLTREVLGFICSGKMSALREVGFVLDSRDWHFFLQNLPRIPHVRSLFIPGFVDHNSERAVRPREIALQLLDVVALRPEIELCYVGVVDKCFEILENSKDDEAHSGSRRESMGSGGDDHAHSETEPEEDVEVVEEDSEDDDDDEGHDGGDHGSTGSGHAGHEFDDRDSDTDSDVSEFGDTVTRKIRLREILFYDDKVAIFKARHGRL